MTIFTDNDHISLRLAVFTEYWATKNAITVHCSLAPYSSQMYLKLLQHEDPCHPSTLSLLSFEPLTVTVQTRQFSSIELKGSSIQPKSGTTVLTFAHSHTPSTSISFPASQYSLLLRLVLLLTYSTTARALSSVCKLSRRDFLCWHCFLASIQPTRSVDMK